MWALIKVTIPTSKVRRLYFVRGLPYADLEPGCPYPFEFCAGPDNGLMWFTGDEPPCLKEDHCEDCPVTVVEHDDT